MIYLGSEVCILRDCEHMYKVGEVIQIYLSAISYTDVYVVRLDDVIRATFYLYELELVKE